MLWTFDLCHLIIHYKNLPYFFFSTDRHVEKESLAEYIAKKREMFLVQVCDVFPFLFPTMLEIKTKEI